MSTARSAPTTGQADETALSRAAAARAVSAVIDEQRSLTSALPAELSQIRSARARGAAQDLAYNTLRFAWRLQALLNELMERPLKRKDADVHALLLVGLTQLLELDTPAHGAVDSTVSAVALMGKQWAKGLCNAVLRRADRERTRLAMQLTQDWYAHPPWLVERLQQAWPSEAESILRAGNQAPPMTLRVNLAKHPRATALARLAEAGIAASAGLFAPAAVRLARPCDIQTIPGFADGEFSVQDEAAQLAVGLLALDSGQRVLDACAAPGGKTAQILECAPDLAEVVAVESDPLRTRRLHDTLRRLRLTARVLTADAAQTDGWWDGQRFDRILLDAPCSATGVIRRHPDIKFLRHDTDLAPLGHLQGRLLDALWPLLAPGGRLVYVTCSVLPEEGEQQVEAFLARTPEARAVPIAAIWGQGLRYGRQTFPGQDDLDGFYFACLEYR